MFRSIGPPEIILILVVLLLLFGAKRLPDLTRSVGRSMRIFKSEVKEMRADEEPTTSSDPPAREIEGKIQPSAERPAERVPDPERRDS